MTVSDEMTLFVTVEKLTLTLSSESHSSRKSTIKRRKNNTDTDLTVLFSDIGEPILCESEFQGAIDPYLVRDVAETKGGGDGGKLFMSWKRNQYLTGRDSIVIREINEDGLTFPRNSKVYTLIVSHDR